jgi:hypothetical protein
LLLLALPMAFAFRDAPAGSARRAAQHLLLWCSIGASGILAFAQQGFLTANGRDGTSALLEYLSPRWPAWTIAPSFIYHEAPAALFQSMLWLALAAGAAHAIGRVRAASPGIRSLAAMAVTAATLLVAASVMPRLPFEPRWPSLDVRARSRLPLLDEFDAVARPIAIEYSPWRLTSPRELVTHASVMVEPELRTAPQPIRVLHNGRFSLPAGRYRVEIEWSGARAGEQVGLQIGRTGDPMITWPVEARPGETWTAEFAIAVDAGFVGLRGSPELERVIGKIRFVPLSIVDEGERPAGPAIIAASRSGPASLFFSDTNASPEANGFWVWGERQTRVTVARPDHEGPIVLRVHSGPIPNRLRVSGFGWSRTLALRPDSPEELEVPIGDNDVVTIHFAAETAFVPRDLDSQSTDARPLGAWVEVLR